MKRKLATYLTRKLVDYGLIDLQEIRLGSNGKVTFEMLRLLDSERIGESLTRKVVEEWFYRYFKKRIELKI